MRNLEEITKNINEVHAKWYAAENNLNIMIGEPIVPSTEDRKERYRKLRDETHEYSMMLVELLDEQAEADGTARGPKPYRISITRFHALPKPPPYIHLIPTKPKPVSEGRVLERCLFNDRTRDMDSGFSR